MRDGTDRRTALSSIIGDDGRGKQRRQEARVSAWTDKPEPFDPHCQRFAHDMEYLDSFIDNRVETREDYIRTEEGTYNPENGHFLCDDCYMAVGQPSSPRGWICP